ncbi:MULTISPECIES: DapH/DapD/GlmU-related protein [unclassified Lentimicrobium]|uniref:acyltransferase n=1 Tax=unclassified Lentimicrobium TaxID=2677434 RepID=UPI00155772FF|nr:MULTISPECIES: acyltransferase [unclassified Lentimicrobium]NPD46596.1 acyltransferase [Lentimicrobium sp. S6]NPD83815.1 acyltransferase [Lentimicrobium sp. L6]
MGLKEKLKSDPRLKRLVMWMIHPPRRPRPRLWIRLFVNPFFHKKGKHALIRRRQSRIDVMPYNKFDVGAYSTVESFTTVNNGSGDVIIGDRCRVGIGTVIIGPVTMKSGSGTGQHVFMAGFNHGYKDGTQNSSTQDLDVRGITIEEDAHIGANSVIVAGVTIGKRCQVGAGSVVTKDIPPYSVAVGNPARVIKKFNHETNEWEKA